MPDKILDSARSKQLEVKVQGLIDNNYDESTIKEYISLYKQKFGVDDSSKSMLYMPSETPEQKQKRYDAIKNNDATGLATAYDIESSKPLAPKYYNGVSIGVDMESKNQYLQSRQGKAGQIVSNYINKGEANQEDLKYLNQVAPLATAQIVASAIPKVAEKGKADDVDIQTFVSVFPKIKKDAILKQQDEFYKRINAESIQELIPLGFQTNNAKNEPYLVEFRNTIESQKAKEIVELQKKYPVEFMPQTAPGYVGSGALNRSKDYYAAERVVNEKYDKLFDSLGRAAAANVANKGGDELTVGLEYLKYKDPGTYSNRIKVTKSADDRTWREIGTQVMFAQAKDLGSTEKIRAIQETLDEKNPEKLIAETYHRLGAELYKEDNWFLNFNQSIESKDKAAEQLPQKYRDAYYKYIKPIETGLGAAGKFASNIGGALGGIYGALTSTNIPRSGAINQLVQGFETTATGTVLGIADKIGARSQKDVLQDMLDSPYKTRFQNVGEMPQAQARLKDLTNRAKAGETLDVNELEEKADLETYTNVRSTGQKLIDGSFNLAGQVLFQAIGTKGLGFAAGAGLKSLGLLKTAQIATNLGTAESIAEGALNFGVGMESVYNVTGFAVAFASSYDDALQQAARLYPDDENKQSVYANIVATLNGATERIFKDEKVFDAFKREVAPNIANLVKKLGSGEIKKELLFPTLKGIIKDGLQLGKFGLIENVKETTEEVATSVGTSITNLLLSPAKFNFNEAYDDAMTTATTMFTDGGLVALFAGAKGFRANKIGINVLSQLGTNEQFTEDVKGVINQQLLSGTITQAEADEKMKNLNTIAYTNTVDMPTVVQDNKLKPRQANKYAVALSFEKLLKDKVNATTDAALIAKYQNDIYESEQLRKKILNKEVFVDDNYEVLTPEEAKKKEEEKAKTSTGTKLTMPTDEQMYRDVTAGNVTTKEYNTQEEIPDSLKNRISSVSEVNGKQVIRVTIPNSLNEYLTQQENATTTSEEQKQESSTTGNISQREGTQGKQTSETTEANTGYSFIVSEEGAEVPIAALINKKVRVNGQPAILYQEGERIVARVLGTNRILDTFGNYKEMMNALPSEYGIEIEDTIVSETPTGYRVGKDELVNNNENKLDAISVDGNGKVMNVVLYTPSGKRRKFRDKAARDLAYQIRLKEILQDEEQFEQFLESEHRAELDAAAAKQQQLDEAESKRQAELDARKTEDAAKRETNGDNGTVSETEKTTVEPAYGVYTLENRNEVDNIKANKLQRNVLDDVWRVIGAISKLVNTSTGKNLTVSIHNQETFTQAVIEAGGSRQDATTRGFYMSRDGAIHLNFDNLATDTMLHEGFHPVLDFLQKNNPKIINEFFAQLEAIPGAKSIIKKARRDYSGDITQKKEAITDFVAAVADGRVKLDASNTDKFVVWLNNIYNKIGLSFIFPKMISVNSKNSRSQLVQLAKGISESFGTSTEITLESLDSYMSGDNQFDSSGGVDVDVALPSEGSEMQPQFSKASTSKVKESVKKVLDAARNNLKSVASLGGTKVNRVVFYDLTRVGPLTIKNIKTGYTPEVEGKGGPLYSYMGEMIKDKAVLAFTNINQAIQSLQRQLLYPEAVHAIASQNPIKGHLGNKSTLKALFGDGVGIFQNAANTPEDEAEIVKVLVGEIDRLYKTDTSNIKKIPKAIESVRKILNATEEDAKGKPTNTKIVSLDSIKTINDFRDKILLGVGDSFGSRGAILEAILQEKQTKVTRATRESHKILHYKYGIPTLTDIGAGNNQDIFSNATLGDVMKLVKPSTDLVIYTTSKVEYDRYTKTPTPEMKNSGIVIKLLPESSAHESYPFILAGENVALLKKYVSAAWIYKKFNALKKSETFFPVGRTTKDMEVGEIPVGVQEEQTGPQWQRTAPNGKPSKLNAKQYEQVRTPAFKKWFGDWEKDPNNASKVVDENGEPLVVYRGDSSKTDTFGENTFFSSNDYVAGSYSNEAAIPEYEVFLNIKKPLDLLGGNELRRNPNSSRLSGSDPNVVSIFKEAISQLPNDYTIKVGWGDVWDKQTLYDAVINNSEGIEYISYDNQSASWEAIIKYAKDNGFDGVFMLDESVDRLIRNQFSQIAFNSNQSKSATANTGEFSTEDNRIQFQKASPTEKIKRTDTASDKLKQLFNRGNIPLSITEAKEIVNEVIDWTSWYDGISNYVNNIFGEYSEDVLSLLPLSSQAANSATTVALAINNAEKIYKGEKPVGVAEYYGYVTDFLQGKGIKSDKMYNFFKAITGDKDAIAVDMHVWSIIMGKNPNKKQVNPKNKAEFERAKEFVNLLSAELGLAPREVQAALWAANILRTGKNPSSYEQYFEKQLKKGLSERIEGWRNEGYKPFSEVRKAREVVRSKGEIPQFQKVPTKIKFNSNIKGEVDRIKSLGVADEDGDTRNLDGTKYTGGGLVIPASSVNTNQGRLNPSSLFDFLNKNKSKVSNGSSFKIGLYKFPNQDTVSIDLNIVSSPKNRAIAIEFARLAGQESIFDLDTFENIKTGADGMNPINFTDEQFAEIGNAFAEDRMPDVFGKLQLQKADSKLKLQKINWEKSKEGKGDPSISVRNPIVVDAANKLKAGTITNEEYRATVSENSPITPITRFFEPATLIEINKALTTDKLDKVNEPINEGAIVGLRLDIPAYKNNNTWVVSVHDGNKDNGNVLSYTNVAKINNVRFGVQPKGALAIATGVPKTTIGRMFGNWESIPGNNIEERGNNAKKIIQDIANNPDWVQVGMNPFRHSYFYDRSNNMGKPINSASEVVQVGGLVYAKNPVYGNWTDEAYTVKGLFDSAGKSVQFQKGTPTKKLGLNTKSEKINRFTNKVERIRQNLFTVSGVLGKTVKVLQEKMAGNIAAEINKAERLGGKTKKLIEKYKNVINSQQITDYLTGVPPQAGTSQMPKALAMALDEMREHIDGLTEQLITLGVIDDAETIALYRENKGKYMLRSYELFNAPTGVMDKFNGNKSPEIDIDNAISKLKNVDQAVIDNALMYLANQEMADIQKANPTLSLAEQFKLAKKQAEFLANKILTRQEDKYSTKSVVGSVNVKSISERQDIAPEIRALMGEYTDPIYNYYSTIYKIASLTSSRDYLNKLKAVGYNKFLFDDNSPNRPTKGTVQIAAEESEFLRPLNGLYTFPEMANALKMASSESPNLYRQIAGRVRKYKTVYNPATHFVNVVGNMGFAFSNGHWNELPETYKALSAYLSGSDSPKIVKLIDTLNRQGVLGNSVGVNELKQYFNKHKSLDDLLKVTHGAASTAQKVGKSLTQVRLAAEKAYQIEDDVFKILAFVNESNRYAKAFYSKKYMDLNPTQMADISDKAGEIVKNTYPTFSRVPKFIRGLSKELFLGNFLSFPVESIRNSYNTLELAMRELRSGNSKLIAVGTSRLVGTLAYNGVFTALNYYGFSLAGAGITGLIGAFADDDEERRKKKQIMQQTAPWNQQSADLYISSFKDGKLVYYDIGRLNSFKYQSDVFGTFFSNMGDKQGVLKSSFRTLAKSLEPVFDVDLTYDALIAMNRNEVAETGTNIYNPEEGEGEFDKATNRTIEYGKFMMKKFGPGIITNAMKLYDYYGKGDGKFKDELISTFGPRKYTVDLTQNFYFNLKGPSRTVGNNTVGFADRLENAKKLYNRYDTSLSEGEKEVNYQKAITAYKQVLTEAREYYRGAISGGAKPDDLFEKLLISKIGASNYQVAVSSIIRDDNMALGDNAYIIR